MSLSNEKIYMIMSEGIVLGNYLLSDGIQVNPEKVFLITNVPTLKKKKDVRRFLGHVGYYRIFLHNFSKIVAPLFILL